MISRFGSETVKGNENEIFVITSGTYSWSDVTQIFHTINRDDVP